MFLHIGNGQSVVAENIIGIFDLDTASVSGVTRDFLTRAEKGGGVKYCDTDLPRSFLLTRENGRTQIRLSRISTVGLNTRINTPLGGAEE